MLQNDIKILSLKKYFELNKFCPHLYLLSLSVLNNHLATTTSLLVSPRRCTLAFALKKNPWDQASISQSIISKCRWQTQRFYETEPLMAVMMWALYGTKEGGYLFAVSFLLGMSRSVDTATEKSLSTIMCGQGETDAKSAWTWDLPSASTMP